MFAQLERETIQKRVSDAYYSRSQKGFRMGGKPPYGYRLEEILMEGIHTKKLVEEPGEAAIVREIFDMYEQPDTSYGDITRYYAEKGVQFYGKELIRSMLAQLLRNPVYVRADMDVYRFFRSHGTNIVSSLEQFDGFMDVKFIMGGMRRQISCRILRDKCWWWHLMRGLCLRSSG